MSDQQTPQEKSGGKAPIFIILIFIIAISVGGLYYLSQTDDGNSVERMAESVAEMGDEVVGNIDTIEQAAENQTEQVEDDMADAGEEAEEELADAAEAVTPDEEAEAAPVIKEGNPVVAVVDNEEIKRNEVMEFISKLPEQLKALPLQTTFPLALEEVVADKVVTKRIEDANMSEDPEVQKLIEQAQEQITRTVYLERQIKKELTDENLRAEYNKLIADIEDVKETKARHILLEDEATANEVIAKLDDGADFAELAKEYSKGPTSQNGGDLGYFSKREMVPAFADAAFALNVGKYSKEPVQTQFGYHVIKVEDRRDAPKPDFETVKAQLQQKMSQEVAVKLLSEWKQEADVKKFDINGEPIEEKEAVTQ